MTPALSADRHRQRHRRSGVIDVGQYLVIFVGRSDGFGLRIVDRNENDLCGTTGSRPTRSAGIPASTSFFLLMTYPVLYLLHGGAADFRQFDFLGIRGLTAGKPIIVVMPDGARRAGTPTRWVRSSAREIGRHSTSPS